MLGLERKAKMRTEQVCRTKKQHTTSDSKEDFAERFIVPLAWGIGWVFGWATCWVWYFS